MGRKKAPPEPAGDIPAWFMTYSDVITLLMTFFILLLTFASSEPEKFERLQVSLFGGAGSTGFAGDVDSRELDSILQRERPRAARLTMEGSRMPPTHSDPLTTTDGQQASGLTEEERNPTAERFLVTFRHSMLFDQSGNLTAHARRIARLLGLQMKRIPMDVSLLVSPKVHSDAMKLVQHIATQHKVLPGRLAVGTKTDDPTLVRFMVVRQVQAQ